LAARFDVIEDLPDRYIDLKIASNNMDDAPKAFLAIIRYYKNRRSMVYAECFHRPFLVRVPEVLPNIWTINYLFFVHAATLLYRLP